MYWPVGAPQVYALSKHTSSSSSTTSTESHDGVESAEPSNSSHGDRSSVTGQETSSTTNDKGANGGEDVVRREHEIVDTKLSRSGSLFATITRSSLTIWQTRPAVVLASVVRSSRSIKAYGPSTALVLRPDALVAVVQTRDGYLISYSLATDPHARVYATQVPPSTHRHGRKDSGDGFGGYHKVTTGSNDVGGDDIREVNIRFRLVMRIDAGISKTLALDDELVVATQKPAALQCIAWVSDNHRAQTSTELVSKMSWIAEKCTVVDMIHDRPMNLTCWITSDGRAYAVQRRSPSNVDMDNPASLFQGFCFRGPQSSGSAAVKAAINARFSLIAVGCADGQIDVFVVKDYTGNIPQSHQLKLHIPLTVSGKLTFLAYSPDGYCLLAGFEKGWALWSVYGKPGAHSFATDKTISETNHEGWLLGVKAGFWIGGGSQLILQGIADDRLWALDMARNAFTACYSPPSISQGLLQTSNSIWFYRGHDVPDLTALPADMSLWQTVQTPSLYLAQNWPMKFAVISADTKYIAVAGRRGLAHYSTASARWRTFDDPQAEQEFAVRGGMCWFQHFLIACVEAGGRSQIRVYSREKSLSYSNILLTEELSAPVIFVTVCGTDSLLVYTYDNMLLHFIILPRASSIKLVQVGQIGFHGIIRAPPRVRAISWILPEDQLEHGDPSQDVAKASVLFLVDGKLVLLQPSTNEQGDLKYDMRVIAQNVEYFVLLQDCPSALPSRTTLFHGLVSDDALGHSLRDSLWYFDGAAFHVWSDVQDVLAAAPADLGRELPPTARIPVDFYPLSPMAGKGIINGLDSDMIQRRDVNFSFARLTPRTSLFLPQLLRQHLAEYNSPAALHLSHSYQHLPYFSHALEILLHDILDAEVDNPPSPPETALLPSAISFLSSFPAYLDVIVNCTRKTELRSWRTLFSHLPPVLELFEQSLAQNKLKTAAGYLLILHTFEHDEFKVQEFTRLFKRAAGELDWELCGELARFLVGIDGSGETLKHALAEASLDGSLSAVDRPSLDEIVLNGEDVDEKDFVRNGSVDYFTLQRTAE